MYSFCSCKPRQNNMVTSEHAMTTLYLGAHFKSPQFPKQCENYHRKFRLFALHPVVINSNTHRPSPLLLEFSPSSPTSHLPSPTPEQFRVIINTDTFASSIPISSSRPFTVMTRQSPFLFPPTLWFVPMYPPEINPFPNNNSLRSLVEITKLNFHLLLHESLWDARCKPWSRVQSKLQCWWLAKALSLCHVPPSHPSVPSFAFVAAIAGDYELMSCVQIVHCPRWWIGARQFRREGKVALWIFLPSLTNPLYVMTAMIPFDEATIIQERHPRRRVVVTRLLFLSPFVHSSFNLVACTPTHFIY